MIEPEKLVNDLIRDEALRLKPYFDTATPPRMTIGVGRNLGDRGISRAEAYYMLTNDIEGVVADLDQHVPWWTALTPPRQRVLANMCFNMGIQRLLGFSNMLAHAHAGEYANAADDMLASLWARQVGSRASRLATTMREGV